MSLRTVCFVGAVLVGAGWLRWVLVAGALVLPYIAVVMANATASRSDGFELMGRGEVGHQLTSGKSTPIDPPEKV